VHVKQLSQGPSTAGAGSSPRAGVALGTMSTPTEARPPAVTDETGGPQPSGTGEEESPSLSGDGRQRRRQRNRDAVVAALLDLYADGNLRPSAEEIASRSGLSPRSLFRYFDDVDDLIRAALTRQQTRVIPLVPIGATPEEPLSVRISALVEQRFRIFDAVGNAAAVVRLRAPFEPVLDGALARHRAFLRSQIESLFAAELAAMGRSAGSVLSAADVVTSYESRHLLVNDQGLEPSRAMTVMAATLTSLLSVSTP
jgi:TetR/AcrR family transcriptional regulator, regulator of autoinduction and epiphytic fitness